MSRYIIANVKLDSEFTGVHYVVKLHNKLY